MRLNRADNDGIKASRSKDWEGSIDYNQFMDSYKELRSADISNIVLKFEVGTVLYSDGEKVEF